jgi:hypothetical protein
MEDDPRRTFALAGGAIPGTPPFFIFRIARRLNAKRGSATCAPANGQRKLTGKTMRRSQASLSPAQESSR